MRRWLPRGWRRAPEILRWRGVSIFLLLTLREIFRPILYWYVWNIFQTDLSQPLPEPYAKERMDLEVHCGEKNWERARDEVFAFGDLAEEEIERRLRRGDAVAMAYDGSRPAGYMWLTFTPGMDLAFDTSWIVGADEGVKYDSFVGLEWRGRGVHSYLNAALNRYARERGLARLLGSVSALNTQSLRLAKRSGRAKSMTVILFHVRWVKWTWRKAIGAPLESRFSVGPGRG